MIEERKKRHLDASLSEGIRGNGAGLENIQLPYDALFEISDEQLDTTTTMAGIRLAFPLMIGAMTGGTTHATSFNTCLRQLAARHGIALCLGSMRAYLKNPQLLETYGTGEVPALFANLGASEINTYSVDEITSACNALGCKGLFIHLNGLQEFIQDDGNAAFSVSLDDLARFCERFKKPVFIKEVGSGIGGRCAQRLATLPIAGIETAALGGTSWIKIESRLSAKPRNPQNIKALCQVGYTLEQSIRDCAKALKPHQTLIASGGISNALDIIKSLALGADLAAIAQPVYAAWHQGGDDSVDFYLKDMIEIARLIWRSTGSGNLKELVVSR